VAEVHTSLEPLVPLQHIAHIPVPTIVVDVVVRLHQPVLFDDPGHLRSDIRPNDPRRNLRVVIRRELITEVMDQCRNDQLIVCAIA
jgi:hypothetical protein